MVDKKGIKDVDLKQKVDGVLSASVAKNDRLTSLAVLVLVITGILGFNGLLYACFVLGSLSFTVVFLYIIASLLLAVVYQLYHINRGVRR